MRLLHIGALSLAVAIGACQSGGNTADTANTNVAETDDNDNDRMDNGDAAGNQNP